LGILQLLKKNNMKKILFLILLLIGLKGFACQCMAPIPPFTFICDYMNGPGGTYYNGCIIKGLKIGSTSLGTNVKVLETLYGTPPADTLLFWNYETLEENWGNTMMYCLNYSAVLSSDTLVLSSGNLSIPIENNGLQTGSIIGLCITSYLTIHNNMVFGNVSDGVSMMPYTQLVETLQACLPTVGIQPAPLPAMAAVEEVTCHPNPIQGNTAAQVQFTLPQPAPIQVAIYDISGKLVSSITPPQTYPKGTHLLTLPAQDLPAASGIYFCRITTPQSSGVCKIAVAR